MRVVVGSLLIALLVQIPMASAQVPEIAHAVTVTPHGVPIVPITEAIAVPFVFTVTCPAGTPEGPLEPIRFAFGVATSESWAVVNVVPPVVDIALPPQECLAGTTKEAAGNVTVMLTKDAPAGALFEMNLTVSDPEGAVASETWSEKAGTYVKTQARFDQAIHQVRPGGKVELIVHAANHGNGAMIFTLQNDAAGNGSLEIVLPIARTIASGDTLVLRVGVVAPSSDHYVNRRDEVALTGAFASIDNETLAETHQLIAVVQTQGGLAGESPGPVLFVPLLIGLLALLRRRAAAP